MDKLYTIPGVAEYSGASKNKVRRAANSGLLVGQVVAGTYIFSEAAIDAWLLGLKVEARTLLTINTAAKKYGVSRNRLHTLIQEGTLPAIKIKARGSAGWAYVFYDIDLRAVGKDLSRIPSGPAVKDDIDRYLEHSSGRYAILGTKNKYGHPFSYKHKNQARRRAREAYGEELLYTESDSVFIKPKDGHMVEAVLVEDVTWIDQTILIKHNNRKPALVPIRWLWGKRSKK